MCSGCVVSRSRRLGYVVSGVEGFEASCGVSRGRSLGLVVESGRHAFGVSVVGGVYGLSLIRCASRLIRGSCSFVRCSDRFFVAKCVGHRGRGLLSGVVSEVRCFGKFVDGVRRGLGGSSFVGGTPRDVVGERGRGLRSSGSRLLLLRRGVEAVAGR